jgi:hypothetical protein
LAPPSERKVGTRSISEASVSVAAPSPAAGPDGALFPPQPQPECLQLQRKVLFLPLLDRQRRAHQAGGSHERGARRKGRVRAPVQRPALVWHDQQVLHRRVDAHAHPAQRGGCAAGMRRGRGESGSTTPRAASRARRRLKRPHARPPPPPPSPPPLQSCPRGARSPTRYPSAPTAKSRGGSRCRARGTRS